MKSLLSNIRNNTNLYFRIVLFCTFLGHGLVNLGLSPSIALHINLIKAAVPFDVDPAALTDIAAVIDLTFAFLILFNIAPKYTLAIAFTYISMIAFAGWALYYNKKESVFGIAEIMRRLPWIFFIAFLYLSYIKKINKYHLLRIGLSFAFLAHGIASMGLLGLNQGHIELASQLVPEDKVRDFVFYTGISDTVIGILLLSGIFSRPAAIIGICWIIFVVIIAFNFALPDGIFRLGFLLSAIYIAVDKRC